MSKPEVMECTFCRRRVKHTRDWIDNLKGWHMVRVWNIYERRKQGQMITGDTNDKYCVRTVVCCPRCAGPRVRDMRPKKRPEEYYRTSEMVDSQYAADENDG